MKLLRESKVMVQEEQVLLVLSWISVFGGLGSEGSWAWTKGSITSGVGCVGGIFNWGLGVKGGGLGMALLAGLVGFRSKPLRLSSFSKRDSYSCSVILWAFFKCSFRYLTLTLHTRHSWVSGAEKQCDCSKSDQNTHYLKIIRKVSF